MTVTPDTSPQILHIREQPAGDRVTGFYLLTKIESRPKRDGTPYLTMELRDATGRIEAKMWEGFEEILSEAKAGDVIKVAGTIDHYLDTPSLIVSRIRKAAAEEAPNRRAYLPHSDLTAEQAAADLDEIISTITNDPLKTLLEAVFGDEEFRVRFVDAPGGKLWHHATLGGLAEHTISIAWLAAQMAEHYPQLNRDLLVAGALLHDVGKVFELSSEIAFDYTSEGRLLGHIVQGTMFVDNKIDAIPEFPPETRKQLLHLILSHQGDGTMGSPVKPMTVEALVLHYLDDLDSKVNAFEQVREKTPEGQEFSDWVNLMERFFYFKPTESSGDDDDE